MFLIFYTILYSLCWIISFFIFANISLYEDIKNFRYENINIHLKENNKNLLTYLFISKEKLKIKGFYIKKPTVEQLNFSIYSIFSSIPLIFWAIGDEITIYLVNSFWMVFLICLAIKSFISWCLENDDPIDVNKKTFKWIIDNLKEIELNTKNKNIFIHDFYRCNFISSLLTIVLLFSNQKEEVKLTIICSDKEHENWKTKSYQIHNLEEWEFFHFSDKVKNDLIFSLYKNKKIKEKEKIKNKIENLEFWLKIRVVCPKKYEINNKYW